MSQQLVTSGQEQVVAIKNGIDLVIELPFVYSVQSADYFAQGAIELLAKLKVTDIVFGSECGNINYFQRYCLHD